MMIQPVGRRKKLFIAALFLGAAAIAGVYFFIDPVSTKWMPRCVFNLITGFECPGCGSQRMIHALLHGDIPAAWKFNPMMFILIPLTGVYFLLEIIPERLPRLYKVCHSSTMIYIIGAMILAWWILRNI